MADGITHVSYLRKIWSIIIPLGVILLLVGTSLKDRLFLFYPIFLYINFFLCEFIDPDNDLMSLSSAESRVMRLFKRFYLGFFGALFVAYFFIYAYICGLFGGHRSWISHGWVIGTIGRMIFFNFPFLVLFYISYYYGLSNWGWRSDISMYNSFAMEQWFPQYIIIQFIAWFIGDGCHLILDTEWAKDKLYVPNKKEGR